MSAFTILQQTTNPNKIVLVEQQYPYGKNSVYMPMALVVVAAQLMAVGREVEIVDFNIDNPESDRIKNLFKSVEIVGVSVIGAPYIPQTIQLCHRLAIQYPELKVMVGGQVISRMTSLQFSRLFVWTNAIRIAAAGDLEPLFGVVPSPYKVSLAPVYERMGKRLDFYLRSEFPLWVSQGCIYNCSKYCTAPRNQPETHHDLAMFQESLEYLVQRAMTLRLPNLSCYASSLDFFQNPTTVAKYLEMISSVRGKFGFDFRIRALSCLKTFLKASHVIRNFGDLLNSAGFWCVGFGVDGSGESEWKRQGKVQNHTSDVKDSLDLCKKLGLKTDVIMVCAYPTSTVREHLKTVYNSFGYLVHWPNMRLRAYLAKMVLPGNDGWECEWKTVEAVLENPKLFYNFEFNCLASPLTHPRRFNRYLGNFCFLLLTLGVAVFGRSISYPLFPQGQPGLYGKIAKFLNRRMPIVD